MKKLSDQDVKLIKNSIIFNFLASFYNDQIKHTPMYKKSLKLHLNRLNKELEKDLKMYDELDKFELWDTMVENIQILFDEVLLDPADIIVQGNILLAFKRDSEAMSKVADQILNQK